MADARIEFRIAVVDPLGLGRCGQDEPAFYVDAGQSHCSRCGDTNFNERLVCLTCTYPDDPCSGVR